MQNSFSLKSTLCLFKIFLTVAADELDANQGGRFNFGTSNRRNLALARRDGGGSYRTLNQR